MGFSAGGVDFRNWRDQDEQNKTFTNDGSLALNGANAAAERLQAADLFVFCNARSRRPGAFKGLVYPTDAPRVYAFILTSVFGLGTTPPSTFYKCHNDDEHDRCAVNKRDGKCQPF